MNHAALLAIIKQVCSHEILGLAGDYQAAEQALILRPSWRLSSSLAGMNHAAQLAIIKQMSRHASCGSAGDYQEAEQALIP